VFVSVCITFGQVADELFDLDLLEEDPFEIDAQSARLFKRPRVGIEDHPRSLGFRPYVPARQTTTG
jgi:hypothetical protein